MENKHNHVDENKFGLRACPFCGLAHTVVYSQENAVECYECDIYGPSYLDKSKAVAAWNSRPLEDALTAEVTALRARVAELEAEARWVSVEERLPDWEVSFEADTTFGVKIGWRDISEGYVTDGEYTWEYTHWRYITPPEAE